MSLSPLPYVGSKRTDIKFFESKMPNPNDIDVSVELFGGSGYVSLYLFSKNNKIKSIINDIDEQLINFFKEVKRDFNAVIDGYNTLIEPKPSKEDFEKLKDEYFKNESNNLRRAILYLFVNKYHGIRKYMYPLESRHNCQISKDKFKVFQEWLKNTEFTNENYDTIYEIINNNKSDKKFFILIDPPYFDSFNKYYISYTDKLTNDNIIKDTTGMFIDIIKYLKECKKKMLLIINKNGITEYLYKDYIKGEYNKTYSLTKNKTIHLIIDNYNKL
jgi:site-specific DNA-adenine methylase